MKLGHALLACALSLAACDPQPACDPGQHEDTGSCLPAPASGGGADAAADATSSDDDAGGASDSGGSACQPGPGNYDGFGDTCASDDDCGCIAPTCATPGLEYCTRFECQDDPTACPPGWTCADIEALAMMPGVTHMCMKQ